MGHTFMHTIVQNVTWENTCCNLPIVHRNLYNKAGYLFVRIENYNLGH